MNELITVKVMSNLGDADWDALERLASRVAFSQERISTLRKRLRSDAQRPGSPLTLLVGRPSAGLEILLARWLAPEATEALRSTPGRLLIIGPQPESVQPKIGVWPSWQSKYENGHLLCLLAERVDGVLLAQLASLGFVDQLVLVTRLSQPLHERERELARSMASLATTVRVVIVGLEGEEPTLNDIAELQAFAASQMRQAGFGEGRCLGAEIWFTDLQPRIGAITDLHRFLTPDATAVERGRGGMSEEGIARLFADLQESANHASQAAPPPIPDEERERLTRELNGYLSDLGRELTRRIAERPKQTSDDCRDFVRNALRGWGAHASVEGHWLKYVEKLRSGTERDLLKEAEAALTLLTYEPAAARAAELPPAPSAGAGVTDRVILEAQCLAIGLAIGVGAYFGIRQLFQSVEHGANHLAATVVSWASLILGATIGYGVARRSIRPVPVESTPQRREQPPPTAVQGWQEVQRRLVTWFGERFAASPASISEECRTLAQRFGIKVNSP